MACGAGPNRLLRERIVATLLMTGILSSTDLAVGLGGAAWKEMLAGHGDRMRRELDRFRGREVTPRAMASWPSSTAQRAVRCGAGIRDRPGPCARHSTARSQGRDQRARTRRERLSPVPD